MDQCLKTLHYHSTKQTDAQLQPFAKSDLQDFVTHVQNQLKRQDKEIRKITIDIQAFQLGPLVKIRQSEEMPSFNQSVVMQKLAHQTVLE